MIRPDWRTLAPAEVLEQYPALTIEQVAYVLNLTHGRGVHAGQPDRRQVDALVRTGSLLLIDPSQPVTRQTISATIVRRYMDATAEGASVYFRPRVAS